MNLLRWNRRRLTLAFAISLVSVLPACGGDDRGTDIATPDGKGGSAGTGVGGKDGSDAARGTADAAVDGALETSVPTSQDGGTSGRDAGGTNVEGGVGGGADVGPGSLDAGVRADAAPDHDAGSAPDVSSRPNDGGASAILVPNQGSLLGAFIGAPASVASRESLLGRRLAIIHNFFGWTDDWVARARTDAAGGRIPLITWIPNSGTTAISLDDIIAGVHDTLITTRAQAARAIGQKFFLRWGHEMNGSWTNWNASHYGSNAAGAAKFAQAWQHIHDIFTAAGATNVLWVFCPNVNSVPVAPWNTWQSYYPGDAFVDWVGYDGYNFGTAQAGFAWESFSSIASQIYGDLASTGKPIMIAETSSSEVGGDKGAWISAIVPALKGSYPAIKALVWFDAACGGGFTWCIDSSPPASTAFVSMSLDPYFNP